MTTTAQEGTIIITSMIDDTAKITQLRDADGYADYITFRLYSHKDNGELPPASFTGTVRDKFISLPIVEDIVNARTEELYAELCELRMKHKKAKELARIGNAARIMARVNRGEL